jgi:hypothetical protein
MMQKVNDSERLDLVACLLLDKKANLDAEFQLGFGDVTIINI